jgi:hypothetical protein
MTPKEKANDLFDKMHWSMPHPSTTNAETYIISKRCAIVAVDEILSAVWINLDNEVDYWQEVKQEIENL